MVECGVATLDHRGQAHCGKQEDHTLAPNGPPGLAEGLPWHHWDPTQRSRTQLLRDPFVRATQRALGGDAPRGRHVHLFLNGLYWGIYDIAERADADFFADRAGAERGMC